MTYTEFKYYLKRKLENERMHVYEKDNFYYLFDPTPPVNDIKVCYKININPLKYVNVDFPIAARLDVPKLIEDPNFNVDVVSIVAVNRPGYIWDKPLIDGDSPEFVCRFRNTQLMEYLNCYSLLDALYNRADAISMSTKEVPPGYSQYVSILGWFIIPSLSKEVIISVQRSDTRPEPIRINEIDLQTETLS